MDKYRDPSDSKLRDEYSLCNKGELVDNFQKAKEAKATQSAPMRVKSSSVSKRVYSKVGNITASVRSYYFLEPISYPSLVSGTQSTIWD